MTELQSAPTSADDPLARALLRLVTDLVHELHPGSASGRQVLTLSATLDKDLGLDSLSRVELISRIERQFNIALPDAAFAEIQRLEDLLSLIHAGRTESDLPFMITVEDRQADSQSSVTLPPPGTQSLVDVLTHFARQVPDRIAIQLLDEQLSASAITYAQLLARGREVAYGLLDLDLRHGDAVAIMLPTSADYFYSFIGVLLAGNIPVPIYPPARISQLEDHLRRHCAILNNCQAKVLVTVEQALPLSHLLQANTPSLKHVVTVSELREDGGQAPIPALRADNLAFLQYTSGSTGNPKGVMLTHGNVIANISAMGTAIQATAEDVFVSWLPLYHDMGLIGAWFGSLFHGMPLVIMPPTSFLARPQRWLWAIQRYGGTLSAAPNFAYELCLRRIASRDIEGLDLSTWRFAFNGAEPVSPTTLTAFCERFGKNGFDAHAMAPVYGLAECAVGLCLPPLHRTPRIDCIDREQLMLRGRAIPATEETKESLQFVACGRPLSGHELRIVDAAGRELPERHEGDVQFRGPSATAGYYNNAAATKALFSSDWLQPGDKAYISQGDIYVTGRRQDIIIRAGRNIYPHELEEAISALPGVRQGRVAVFGSPDPAAGTERLIIVAETRNSRDEARADLISQINATATAISGNPPDDVVLAPPGTVLRTSSGKIRRSACRELYEQEAIGRKPAPIWRQLVHLSFAAVRPIFVRGRQSAAERLRGMAAWTMLCPLAVLAYLAVIVCPSRSTRWHVLGWLARMLACIAGTGCTVTGLEHLPARTKSAMFVSNHCSYADVFVITAFLQPLANFVAKAELQRSTAMRYFLERLGTRFVERFDQQRSVADVQRLLGVLHEEESLWVFPEGTFSRRPGLMPFHLGAFVTAAQADVSVIPVAIHGTRTILRDGTWLPRPGAVTITIGPPIRASDEHDADPWRKALQLRSSTRAFILQHCQEPDLQPTTAL